jgi:hypothetical protein
VAGIIVTGSAVPSFTGVDLELTAGNGGAGGAGYPGTGGTDGAGAPDADADYSYVTFFTWLNPSGTPIYSAAVDVPVRAESRTLPTSGDGGRGGNGGPGSGGNGGQGGSVIGVYHMHDTRLGTDGDGLTSRLAAGTGGNGGTGGDGGDPGDEDTPADGIGAYRGVDGVVHQQLSR